MMIPVSQPTLGPTERALVNECFDRNQLTYGPKVQQFEKEFAAYLNIPHVLAVSSGTTALHLVLAALGIGPGDEVIVPDLTFVATANAVHYTGATVVLADIDPVTWCMDVKDAERKITTRTRAIIPVHLYGVAANMPDILSLASSVSPGLFVIEDAAEGLGGTHSAGFPLGTMSLAGTFSFYGNKVLTTGEGGAVCTYSEALRDKMYSLRGQAMDPARRFFHIDVGYNYRMTDMQAAVGLGQLTHLEDMLEARRKIFLAYDEGLYDVGYTPCVHPDVAPWLFTLLLHKSERRDDLMFHLAEHGIETRPAFVPMHRMPMYRAFDSEFPNACKVGDGGISLPTFPELPLEQVERICSLVRTHTQISSDSSRSKTTRIS